MRYKVEILIVGKEACSVAMLKKHCFSILLALVFVLTSFVEAGYAQSDQIENVGKTISPRIHHNTVLLKDGRVLILGSQ